MTEGQTVKFLSDDNGIATVTLSRPESANALNSQMAHELRDIFFSLPDAVKIVILTGAGEKTFCAGADLKERNSLGIEAWQIQHQQFRQVINLIMELRVPVIAAVNGAAYGGGLELAMACDFIYAAETAKFAMPEVSIGIMPGMGGTQNLTRAVGIRRAKEILYTGEAFTATEAEDFGLVNKVLPLPSLMPEVLECARKIIQNAPLSIKAVKRTIYRSVGLPPYEGMNLESDYYNGLLHTHDRAEGVTAWGEKRRPSFSGS